MPRSNILLRILVMSAGGAFTSAAPLACSSTDSPNTISYGGAGPGGNGGNSGAGLGSLGAAGGAAGNSVGGGLFIDSGGGAAGAGGAVVDGCAQGEEQAKDKARGHVRDVRRHDHDGLPGA